MARGKKRDRIEEGSSPNPPSQNPSSSRRRKLPISSEIDVPTPLPKFITPQAHVNFDTLYYKKNIIPGRKVNFEVFSEYNLEFLFDALGLKKLVTIHTDYYPNLVKVFYANLSVSDYALSSRVNGIDVRMSYDEFADFLGIPYEGYDVLNDSLSMFDHYPEGHSKEFASKLIHKDSNPALVQNKNVHLFTPQCQVIAKIIMHSIVPKAGEFDRARGCATLLIYCILTSLRVNIPKLILDTMTSPNIATKSLPFGMLLTLLFKHWGIDLTSEYCLSPPSPLDRSFLHRKLSHRAPCAQSQGEPDQPQDQHEHPILDPAVHSQPTASSSSDPYSLILSRLDSMSLTQSQLLENQSQILSTQSHFAAALRYIEDRFSYFYSQHDYPDPPYSEYSHPLPLTGPPFAPWTAPTQGFAQETALDVAHASRTEHPDQHDD